MTKEQPIIMNTEMVQAILDGRKTQTRCIIKDLEFFAYYEDKEETKINYSDVGVEWFANAHSGDGFYAYNSEYTEEGCQKIKCPYGEVGNRLWVRETWQKVDNEIFYKAGFKHPEGVKWKPSIHMPRWASRILLEIIDIRVEKLQDITVSDIQSEGIRMHLFGCSQDSNKDYVRGKTCGCAFYQNKYVDRPSVGSAFMKRWNSIYEKLGYGWNKNSWVWVIEFKRVEVI